MCLSDTSSKSPKRLLFRSLTGTKESFLEKAIEPFENG